MAFAKRILLGRITKIHPYRGTVTVELSKGISVDISALESVFIEIDGKQVPFFLYEYSDSQSGILKLSFEGYESSGKMERYNGCRIFIDSDTKNLKSFPDMSSLAGFRVYSQNNDLIGNISRVINNPGQLLLQIFSDSDREILVPLHDDLILELEEEKRYIKIEIADGLAEVN
jgi:16S rRNA processing protein RimM